MSRKSRNFRIVLVTFFGLILVGAAAGAFATLNQPVDSDIQITPDVNVDLEMHPIVKLPSWAQEAIESQNIGPGYHFQALPIDLNGDGSMEIIVAQANDVPDVFIPTSPVRVLATDGQHWNVIDTRANCRPTAIAQMKSDGYWDFACANDNQEAVVLRFDGEQYRAQI